MNNFYRLAPRVENGSSLKDKADFWLTRISRPTRSRCVPSVKANIIGPRTAGRRNEGLTTKPVMEVRMATGFTTPILPILEGPNGIEALERFWSKVDVRGPNDCWLWQASVNDKGYGRFKLASYYQVQAHRVALISVTRQEPCGKLVLHRCDVPSCVNPAHLRFGTVAENNLDKMHKGRGRTCDQRGFNNKAAKITPETLAFIVEKMREGWNNCRIAREIGVTHQAISKIRTGKHWTAQVAEITRLSARSAQ